MISRPAEAQAKDRLSRRVGPSLPARRLAYDSERKRVPVACWSVSLRAPRRPGRCRSGPFHTALHRSVPTTGKRFSRSQNSWSGLNSHPGGRDKKPRSAAVKIVWRRAALKRARRSFFRLSFPAPRCRPTAVLPIRPAFLSLRRPGGGPVTACLLKTALPAAGSLGSFPAVRAGAAPVKPQKRTARKRAVLFAVFSGILICPPRSRGRRRAYFVSQSTRFFHSGA